MKPSRYTKLIDSGNGTRLAFNAASAALAEVDHESLPIVKQFLEGPALPMTPAEQQVFDVMVEGRFLVPDEIDEFERLKLVNRQRRYGNTTLFLTIAPTLACNFKCSYCFERNTSVRMTRDTEDALLSFAEKKLRKSERLLITWFGGEPTLCVESMIRLQSGLTSLAGKYQVEVHPSSIVTNGYLLDRQMARQLKEVGIVEAQITLDGPRAVHDSRRMMSGNRGTFDRIVANLGEVADLLRIVIRVNIDRENMQQAEQVLEGLRANDVLDKVNIYFAQVNPAGGACADLSAKCLTTKEFAEFQVELYRKLVATGWNRIEYPSLAPGGHCGADSENAYVVAPDGTLFKCWEELSDDSSGSVGNVHTAEISAAQNANAAKFLSWDPFDKAECVKCDILPICMGGCPRYGLQHNSATIGYCCSWKHNLQEMLLLRAYCVR